MLDRNTLPQLIESKNIPGVSLAIKNGDSIESYSFGIIDVNNPIPVNNKTIFEAASLSKLVFAYIVLKKIEKGLLSRPGESPESGLDRPLHEICDFGPPHMRHDENYKLLTARLLLSHQAGLANEFGSASDEKYFAAVGTRFDYSGIAYIFLNDVIEYVTGKKLHQLSQEIFNSDELKMKNSRFISYSEGSSQRELRARGHDATGKRDENEHFPSQFPPHPAASLLTTADDYMKFMNACFRDAFIRKNMFAKPIILAGKDKIAIDEKVPLSILNCLEWGVGMGLQKTEAGMIAFHWGDVNTFRSFCAINLENNNAVVILTNSANGPAIFKQIAEPIVGNLTPVFTWLKTREKKPLALEDKAVENTSITTQSIFSQPQESNKDDKREDANFPHRKKDRFT